MADSASGTATRFVQHGSKVHSGGLEGGHDSKHYPGERGNASGEPQDVAVEADGSYVRDAVGRQAHKRL
jgi:hypothetical protein